MAAALAVVAGPHAGEIYRLVADETTIGRRGCDVVLEDHLISRKQAKVIRSGAKFEIEDLDSRNGTFVNKVRITRAGLQDKDQVLVGQTVLCFHKSEPTGPQIAPPVDETTDPLASAAVTLNLREEEILTLGLDRKDLEALRRAESDLTAIYRAGQIINSFLDTEKLCAEALDIILRELPQTDVCSILLLDEETGELRSASHCSRDPSQPEEAAVFSTSIVNALLQEKKAILTYDAQYDGRFDARHSIADYQIRSAMCVPLQSRAQLFGVLQAYTVVAQHRFTVDDLKLLAAIGMQIGSALQNAMLYERLAAEKAALHDAHEKLKAAQEGLVRSERLAAVGRLAAGVVHDVKNPMTVILGRAAMLQMALTPEDLETAGDIDVMESLDAIQQGVVHCNEVINQLLQFARQSKPAMVETSINEVLNGTLAFLSHEITKSGGGIEKELAADLPSVVADANQLQQVFMNIVMNGLQALGEDGRIRVSTEVEAYAGREHVTAKIADNGSGMTEEVRQNLFEPFFTTKKAGSGYGGTGLGLSVTFGIIQNHGGSIDVESELGKGSTFIVRIPLTADEP